MFLEAYASAGQQLAADRRPHRGQAQKIAGEVTRPDFREIFNEYLSKALCEFRKNLCFCIT